MKVVTADQMRRIDQATIEERGVSGFTLMERAGKAVAREVMERFRPDSAAVLAGKGNNGGDGFVAARALHQRGVRVCVYLLFDPGQARGAAADALAKLPEEVAVERIERAQDLREKLIHFDVVIDAILGTGVKGAVTGFLGEVIEVLNACETNVVAIDIPSGLMATVEQSGGPHVRAAVTITIGLPKLGLVMDPGVRSAGVVSIVDIGFPHDLLNDDAITVNLLTVEEMKRALPPRDPAGHKGTFGRVLILGGSEGMTGAAALAARAAVRSGAGLVFSAYPRPLGAIMETNLIEPVKRPLAGREKWFAQGHARAALREARDMNAVALGPGIGQRAATGAFVEEMIRNIEAPLVLDADGLNLIADRPEILKERPGPTVLTPHPGEAARLLGRDVREILADRLRACQDFSAEMGVVTVLKGSQTIVTAPNGQRYVNPTGNSGLAKGGSGDVLTGMIAGLLGQGAAPLDAARLGVFLHGLAADRGALKCGVRALAPLDVIEHIGEAYLYLENEAR